MKDNPDSNNRRRKSTYPGEGTASPPPVNRGKRRISRRKRKRRILVVCIVLGALALLAILAAILLSSFTAPPETENTGLLTQSTPVPSSSAVSDPLATAGPTATPTPSPETEKVTRRDNVYTLLIAGHDRVGMNTDTILVAQMDCSAHTINVISIPRDTLVDVPWSVKKINSVYGNLGAEGLVSEVEDLIGFPIDSYAIIDTYVFRELVDSIGGVYFDVPIYMIYDDPDQNLHIFITPGYQLLNGELAEQVVRFRQGNDGSGYPNGDLGRIETQQAFFKAVVQQILSSGSISNLSQIVDLVVSNTDTDLTSSNLAFYAQEFLKCGTENVTFLTMPYDIVYIRGGSYVSIRLDEWLDMVNEYLNPYTAKVTVSNVNILTYSDETGLSSTTAEAPSLDTFYDYTG